MTFEFIKKIPTGKEVLNPNWPNARWNVTGAFRHLKAITMFTDMVTKDLKCPNPIKSIHGSTPVIWNSGRVTKERMKLEQIDSCFETFKKLGVGIYLTFSNVLIEKHHLEDRDSNFLLDKLSSLYGENNGVIISSDILSEYIRNKYPHLKQVSSIVKVTDERGNGNPKWYMEARERFDKVVIHPDDHFNLELLKEIGPEKMEILVNEMCLTNCKTRRQHYRLISECMMNDSIFMVKTADDFDRSGTCISNPLDKQIITHKRRNCSLTNAEIKILYDMGFMDFKLQGRTETHQFMVYDMTRLMLEPDFIAPLIFKNIA